MTDEFLAPIYDSDRGRVEQRLFDQSCGDLINVRAKILRRYVLARAASGQERGGQYEVVEPPPVLNNHRNRLHASALDCGFPFFVAIDQIVTVRLQFLRQQIFEGAAPQRRSEEHTSELQSLMRISYA